MAWFWRKRTEDRALWQVGEAWPGPSTHAGVQVTPDSALRLSAVWACVGLLADTVSTMPVDAFRQGSREPIEPKPPILTAPAAYTSFGDWAYQVMVSLLTRGNTFAVVAARSGAAERPSQLEPVHPDRVAPQIEPDRRTVVWRLDGQEIDREDLWHLRAYPMPGSPLGLSPIEHLRQSIGLGLGAEQFGAKFFADNATPSGLLTTDQLLNQKMAEETSAIWHSKHQGRRRTAVLGSGVRWQAISVAPEESQFLDSQRFTVQQIARAYRIPPELIGADSGNSMTYSNLESRDLTLLKYAVDPHLVRLENALTELLPRGVYVKFNRAALLRTDTKTRYEAHEIGLRAGFLTVDEARELEDREPLPEVEEAPARPQLEVA
jgi:HK97 family phage portal protein